MVFHAFSVASSVVRRPTGEHRTRVNQITPDRGRPIYRRIASPQDFRQFILSTRDRYPAWFVHMLEDKGELQAFPVGGLMADNRLPYMPEAVLEAENEISLLLGGENWGHNSITLRMISDVYAAAYMRFLLHNPAHLPEKFLRAYVQFWEPIRNMGILWHAVFFVEPAGPGRTTRIPASLGFVV